MRSNRIDEALYGKKYSILETGREQRTTVVVPCNLNSSDSNIVDCESNAILNFNLYDNVGIVHNEALDFYYSKFGPNYINSRSVDGALGMINAFLEEKYGFGMNSDEAKVKLSKILEFATSPSVNIPSLPLVGKVTLNQNCLKALNTVLHDSSRVSGTHQTRAVIGSILMKENELALEPMSLSASALVFSTLAVARYALQYRLESPNIKDLPWIPDDSVARAGWPRWAGADIVGAYTSFQLSMAGIGGSLGGPVGFFGTMAAVGATTSYISTL